MANLLKFFRVESLPTTGGVVGGLYFVHNTETGDGKGKLYVCTASNTFEDYTGLHSYENTNTTYDLATVLNELKGQINLVGSDESTDSIYVEGDGRNIKVSSTADGVKVEHIAPTKGTALVLEAEEKAPGYAGAFTAVTGLKKDDYGHIVDATFETIKLPSEQDLSNYKTKQTAVADVTASGEATTAVTSVTQNANGEITVTKANLPSATYAAVEGEYVSSVTQTNGKIAVTRAKLPTFTESFTGVKVEGVELKNVDGKVNWGLNYDSDKKEIQVLDRNNENAVLDTIDATAFIKDGVVHSGELVWCVIEGDVHTEVSEGTKDAVHCLKLAITTDEVNAEGDPIYDYVHIPLGELCDVYTGADKEITVSADNVIGLADKTVEAKVGDAITPTHEGSFNVVTGVATDTKGRVSSITTTQVTLPSVKAIEDEIAENEAVTSAALNDLNNRLIAVEGLDVGVTSVTGETAELNNSAYVSVKATTVKGAVTLTSTVNAVEATDPTTYSSKGLATDGYVDEKVAAAVGAITVPVTDVVGDADSFSVVTEDAENKGVHTVKNTLATAPDVTDIAGYTKATATGLATDAYVKDYVASQMVWSQF